MPQSDTYFTLKNKSEGFYKEKGSKFLAFAHPINSSDGVKPIVEQLWKEHHNACHVCYAYVLKPDKSEYRINDDGEPHGTAGKPIYGQINSNNLTYVLIVIVRYYGGTKLGVGGLITAYKTAASDAIKADNIIKKQVETVISINFEYAQTSSVMRIISQFKARQISQDFQANCEILVAIRKSKANELETTLKKISTLGVKLVSK